MQKIEDKTMSTQQTAGDRERITAQFLSECFDYCCGELVWRERPAHHFSRASDQKVFNSRQAGTKAGTTISGYQMVNLSIGRLSVHRIVFLMRHGVLPENVDHINGNPLDNRIEKLRASTHQENLRNMKTPSSNTSGIKGVSWHKPTSKWAAGIREGGRWRHLGLFQEIDMAAAARKLAEQRVYGEFSNER